MQNHQAKAFQQSPLSSFEDFRKPLVANLSPLLVQKPQGQIPCLVWVQDQKAGVPASQMLPFLQNDYSFFNSTP